MRRSYPGLPPINDNNDDTIAILLVGVFVIVFLLALGGAR
jgi:hypothetical protein